MGVMLPSNEKTNINLPPTWLLTTEFLLGTCFLYKILVSPQGEGKEDIAPQVNVSSYVAVLKQSQLIKVTNPIYGGNK